MKRKRVEKPAKASEEIASSTSQSEVATTSTTSSSSTSSTSTPTAEASLMHKFKQGINIKVIHVIRSEENFSLAIENNNTAELQPGLELLKQQNNQEAAVYFAEKLANTNEIAIEIQARYFLAKAQAQQKPYRDILSRLKELHQDCIEQGYQQAAQTIRNDYKALALKWQTQIVEEQGKTEHQAFAAVLDTWLDLHEMQQGKPNPEAKRVEQHEYGVSDGAVELGTDNIHQCTVAVIRDLASFKTLLVHIDPSTEPESLAQMMKDEFSDSSNLTVNLMGSTLAERVLLAEASAQPNIDKAIQTLQTNAYKTHVEQSDVYQAASLGNIATALRMLLPYEEKITQLTAGDIGLSSIEHCKAIVIDPVSGNINGEYVNDNYADRWLRDGLVNCQAEMLFVISPVRASFATRPEPILLNNDYVEGYVLKNVSST